MSFFRYPGGKSKLKKYISQYILDNSGGIEEYREPFFGGGSIGLGVISHFQRSWINDIDHHLCKLWKSVIDRPEELKSMVSNFVPSVDLFFQYKDELLEDKAGSDIVITGFKKLAVHQMSYSGLGVKAGGPIGGKKQESKYPVGCRWSPKYICDKIDKANKVLCKSLCTDYDFEELITSEGSRFLYLDPPYYAKGEELYRHSFSIEEHERLASLLKGCKNPWLLSYDDCEEVRKLYSWAVVIDVSVKYTINTSRLKSELFICPN